MAKVGSSNVQVGNKVGHWLIKSGPFRVGRDLRYFCECTCGTEQKVSAISLRAGHSTSCGCQERRNGQANVMPKSSEKITPEIQRELSLISAGYLPPADQFCMVDGAPTWKLTTLARLLGISKEELVTLLSKRGSQFVHDPISELSA